MEGMGSIALLPCGSISGHFIHLPQNICYGLHGIELTCERECSRGEDYRLMKLTILDYRNNKERDVIVECKGHDAARIQNVEHAHGWEKDIVGMLEKKQGKRKISVSFECETLKADKAAEDHIRQFMPKLAGMDAIGDLLVFGNEFQSIGRLISLYMLSRVATMAFKGIDNVQYGSDNLDQTIDELHCCAVNVGSMRIAGFEYVEEEAN